MSLATLHTSVLYHSVYASWLQNPTAPADAAAADETAIVAVGRTSRSMRRNVTRAVLRESHKISSMRLMAVVSDADGVTAIACEDANGDSSAFTLGGGLGDAGGPGKCGSHASDWEGDDVVYGNVTRLVLLLRRGVSFSRLFVHQLRRLCWRSRSTLRGLLLAPALTQDPSLLASVADIPLTHLSLDLRTVALTDVTSHWGASLRSLRLSDGPLSIVSPNAVRSLSRLTWVTDLDLSYVSAFVSFAQLPQLVQLRRLVAVRTGLDDLGIRVAKDSPLALETLDMTWCTAVSGEFARDGAFGRLTWLKMARTAVTTRCLSALASLPSLQHLDVSNCRDVSSLEGLRSGCPSLRSLDASGTCVSALDGLESIVTLETLVLLDCSHLVSLSALDNGARAAAEVSRLRSIVVERSKLSTLQGLRTSSASLLTVDCRDCERLQSIDDLFGAQSALTSLSIGHQKTGQVGERGGDQLLAPIGTRPGNHALTVMTSLKSLKLLAVPALIYRSLPSLPTLSYLSLTKINVRDLSEVMESSSTRVLESLVLMDLALLTSMAHVGGGTCPQMRQLRISGCHALTSLHGLYALPALETLSVCDCSTLETFGDVTLSFSNCGSLQVIMLRALSCLTTEGAAAILNAAPSLTSIDAAGWEHAVVTPYITACRKLCELRLSGRLQHPVPAVSDWSASVELCTSLRSVDLSNTYSVLPRDLEALSRCDALATLSLRSCESVVSVSCLAACRSLTSLDVSQTNVTWWLSGPRSGRPCSSPFHKLTSLNVSSTKIRTLAGIVSDCPRLRSLQLGYLPVDADDIAVHLPKLAWLERVDVTSCARLTTLAPFARCRALTSLKADSSPISTPGGLEGLQRLRSLTHLSLSSCQQVASLSPLQQSRSLTTIAVECVPGITKEECQSCLDAMPQMESLRSWALTYPSPRRF